MTETVDSGWLADTRRRQMLCATLTIGSGAIGFIFGSIALILRAAELALIATPALLIATGAIPAWLLAHQRSALAITTDPQREQAHLADLKRSAGLIGMLSSLPTLLLAMLVAWRAWPRGDSTSTELGLAIAALVAAFPVLICERHLSRTRGWSDAPRLAALCRFAIALLTFGALATVVHALGFNSAVWGQRLAIAATLVICGELALRAALVPLLPAMRPEQACIWTTSTVADLITSAVRGDGLSERFAIDLSQSWALGFVRHIAPVLLLLAVLGAWATTGVTTLGLDERGIYERFGRPTTVWSSGLHCHLPWPFGAIRRVEYGTVHDMALGSTEPLPRIAAEAAPGPAFDRLWDRSHPAEATFVLPGPGAGMRGQAFQLLNSDVRVFWRIGLDDDHAINAAYRVADGDALVRALTGSLLTQEFSTRTLGQVIGIDRDTLASGLRSRLQSALDQLTSGIELTAVVIDAIHPPPAAATAYHGVQAASITAATEISVARSQASRSHHEADAVGTATRESRRALAAEVLTTAAAERNRFTADSAANHQFSDALQLERWLQALGKALSRAQLTIIDHRFSHDDLPLIDLRPTTLPGLTKDKDAP